MKVMKLSYIFILAFVLSACPMQQPASGAQIIVGPGQSIAEAVRVAVDGDVINVLDGVYNERVTINKSITLENQTPRGARTQGFVVSGTSGVTIRGFEVTNSPGGGVHITNSSNVVVSDCWFHDYGDAGVEGNWRVGADGRYTANNVTVRNNLIEGTQFGIGAIGHDWLVEGNEVRGLRDIRGGTADVDYCRFFGERITFRSNFFHDTKQADINDAHLDFFQTFVLTGSDAYCRDITWEWNVLDFTHQGLMARSQIPGKVGNFTFRNNVFKNTQTWMMSIKELVDNVVVDHNVFHIGAINGIGVRAGSSAVITNNIFVDIPNQGAYWANASDLTSSNNLLYNTKETLAVPSNLRAGDIEGDPLFVNPDNYDYSLRSGSPAIGAGTNGTNIGLDTDAAPPVPPDDPPPTPTEGLPATLTKNSPSATISVDLTVPENVLTATVTLTVTDPDQPDEGMMSVNGADPVILFGADGTVANDNQTVDISYLVPPFQLVSGANSFEFAWVATQGYTIEAITVEFTVLADPVPDPEIGIKDVELREQLFTLIDELTAALNRMQETL